jgi:hypothetical protein
MAVITSPLAKSLQGGLIQRVSGGVFGGGRGITPLSSPAMEEDKSSALLETNTETLTTISSSLSTISTEIRSIRDGINTIGDRLASESRLEEAAARADAEYQRRLAERQVRAAGEQELENKIETALSEPVKRLEGKVFSIFGNVMNALKTLFFGWLTNQAIDAIQAYAEGNTEKLKQIGANVLKTFAYLIGIKGAFSLLKTGILRVIGSIGSLAARISKFVVSGLFLRPFEILIRAIKNRWAGLRGGAPRTPPPPPAPPGGPKGPKGGKGPGIFGTLWMGIESFMNAKNGEYMDAAMAALSIMGPGKFVKGLMAAGYAADQIAEIFGSNIFGKDPNKEKQAKEVAEEAKKAKGTSNAQTTSLAQPQTPMMGDKKEDRGAESTPMMGEKSDAPEIKMTGLSIPSGMEGSTFGANVEPQTPMTPSASSLTLGSLGADTSSISGESKETPSVETKNNEPPAAVTPIPLQSADMKMEKLGPEPKKPTTVIAQVPSTPSRQSASGAPSAGTNVPNIRSSNPDNFYALYSQFNYNVVT